MTWNKPAKASQTGINGTRRIRRSSQVQYGSIIAALVRRFVRLRTTPGTKHAALKNLIMLSGAIQIRRQGFVPVEVLTPVEVKQQSGLMGRSHLEKNCKVEGRPAPLVCDAVGQENQVEHFHCRVRPARHFGQISFQ